MYSKKVIDGVHILTGSVDAIEVSEMMLKFSEEEKKRGNHTIADALIASHFGAAMVWGVDSDCEALRRKLGLKVKG